MKDLKGLATGIGSLPDKETQPALDLVFKYLPDIPFWPQLPQRDVREGMVAQFSENLPCLRVGREGLFFKADNKDSELEIFYAHIIANDIDYFKISEDFALGLHRFYQRLEKTDLENIAFIKCQVTGPFTFAATVNDEKGSALLNDMLFSQAFLQGLVMKALWQINMFRKFNKKIILFFDEPYLSSFGSAYTPLNREKVIKGLSELTEAVKAEDVLLGVHCCGNTDWSMFTDVPHMDIISFDAFDYLERLTLYADNLNTFLERGGILCWGIVPTQLFSGEETLDLLVRKIKDGINSLVKKGIGEDLLLKNLLVSPSCGLGTFTPEKSEKIFKLLYETSLFIKEY